MKITCVSKVLGWLTVLVLISSSAVAGAAGRQSAFSSGTTSVGIIASSTRQFDNDYVVLGVNMGYYVIDGLELGIEAQQWFSGDPSISKVSLQAKYVFTQVPTIKPYIGTFYRQTFIENFEDEVSYGGRAGAFVSNNNGVYVGAGIVYERYQDCDRFVDCSTTYPEVLMSINF